MAVKVRFWGVGYPIRRRGAMGFVGLAALGLRMTGLLEAYARAGGGSSIRPGGASGHGSGGCGSRAGAPRRGVAGAASGEQRGVPAAGRPNSVAAGGVSGRSERGRARSERPRTPGARKRPAQRAKKSRGSKPAGPNQATEWQENHTSKPGGSRKRAGEGPTWPFRSSGTDPGSLPPSRSWRTDGPRRPFASRP